MRPLFTLSARWVLLCCCLVFSLALLGATVRLLPWLVAKEVPLQTSLVFAEVLATRGAEVAVLVGFPVGAAIAASVFVERGEARALAALGVGPLRLIGGTAPLAVAAVLCSMVVARTTESTAADEFVGELVGSGRSVCDGARASRRVDVPLASLSWLCLATGPRLVGAVPGLRRGLWFAAADLRAPRGGGGLVVHDLRVVGRSPDVSLHARTASISGLPGGPRTRRGGGLHGALAGLVAAATALSSAWAVLRTNVQRPTGAAASSGAAAVAMVALLRGLDDGQAGPAMHALAVPAGAAVALLLQAGPAAVLPLLSCHVAGRKA